MPAWGSSSNTSRRRRAGRGTTLEFSNFPVPTAASYGQRGHLQLLFFEGEPPANTTYSDRQGNYQDSPSG